ncbi:hypothetical protein N0V90_004147 [Kalmusia sp. IMI 367209]|nr:hypothetical protein N0V90_004147 [Kalmusia sp. IMI 367209]
MTHQSRRSGSTVRDNTSERLSFDEEKKERVTGGDEEKRIEGGLGLGADGHEIEEEIARSVSTADSARPRPAHAKSLRSIKSHQSRAGADGYTCFDDDAPPRPNNSTGTTPPDDPHLVRWDGGDADPINPRSMTMLRRWCIVLIFQNLGRAALYARWD